MCVGTPFIAAVYYTEKEEHITIATYHFTTVKHNHVVTKWSVIQLIVHACVTCKLGVDACVDFIEFPKFGGWLHVCITFNLLPSKCHSACTTKNTSFVISNHMVNIIHVVGFGLTHKMFCVSI